jgi:hypothetical protein
MNINGKDFSDESVVELIKGMEYRAFRTFEREKRLLDFLDVIRGMSTKPVQNLIDEVLETNHYLLLQDLGRMDEANKQ